MADKKNKQKNKWHKRRAGWVTRLCATSVDVGLCWTLLGMVHQTLVSDLLVGLMLVVAYYYGFEFFYGKTPGKMLLRMHLVDKRGEKPSRGRLALRSFLRFGSVLMMLSWRRVTLLDFLSGTRVEKLDLPTEFLKNEEGESPIGWR